MTILLLVCGLIVGSFLNVCICRIPTGESIVWGRSHCPKCSNTLSWWQLIPVVSFILLGGKCAHCKTKISWRYPLVELATGFLYAIVWNRYSLSNDLGPALLLVSILIVVTLIDFDHQIIPNKVVLSGIVLGVPINLYAGILSPLQMLWGFLAGSGLLLAVAILSRGGMGMGDVKLMGMVGLFLGWQNTILSIFLASILGALVGLVMLGLRKATRKTALPFGPFLAISSILILLWGSQLTNAYWQLFS